MVIKLIKTFCYICIVILPYSLFLIIRHLVTKPCYETNFIEAFIHISNEISGYYEGA